MKKLSMYLPFLVLAIGMPSCVAVMAQDGAAKYLETTVVDSRIGDLNFKQGFPDPAATKKLFDFRTFYRGVESVTQNTFGVSLYTMRKACAEAGAGKANQVLVWKNRMDSKSVFLTANSETVYAITFLDLKGDGPTVVESPPKALGILDDMWMRYIGDMGMMGPDKGKGGKFLVLPPGFEGEVPEGYHVMKSRTYGVGCVIRLGLVDNKTDAANASFEKHLKIYPLSQKDNPEPTTLVDASGMEIDTVHSENYTFFKELGALVEEEHADALPDGQKFLLASIGMEFGKPFEPDARLESILRESIKVGAAMLRANMWDHRNPAKYIYQDGKKWWNPFVGGLYTFDPAGFFDYDAQAFFAAYATGVTPAMATKVVGGGSTYLCCHQDNQGRPLDGGKNYRLHVDGPIPAKNFWSVVVYDSASRSMMKIDKPMPAVSSYTDPVINDDGSVDLFFGPKAPEGKEQNWIQTEPEKGWTVIFRLYGPLQPFFDQTWKLNDVELIE